MAIICDTCGQRVGGDPPYHRKYWLEVVANESRASFFVPITISPPPPPEAMFFCGHECLKVWAEKI